MLPVQRKTRSQSKMGRSHQAISPAQPVQCPNCRDWKKPHAACSACGYVRPGLSIRVGKDKD